MFSVNDSSNSLILCLFGGVSVMMHAPFLLLLEGFAMDSARILSSNAWTHLVRVSSLIGQGRSLKMVSSCPAPPCWGGVLKADFQSGEKPTAPRSGQKRVL